MEQYTAVVSASDGERGEWTDIDSALKDHRMEEILVNIGECAIGDSSKVMMCLGLGSCVGVAIYDSNKKIAGLAHVMMPSKGMLVRAYESSESSKKFADIAIPYLVESLVKAGCNKDSMHAKISGGAQMFKNNNDELFDIGKRNIAAVKEQLSNYHIPLVAEDVGGNEGRTMRFKVDTSRLLVRTKSRMLGI